MIFLALGASMISLTWLSFWCRLTGFLIGYPPRMRPFKTLLLSRRIMSRQNLKSVWRQLSLPWMSRSIFDLSDLDSSLPLTACRCLTVLGGWGPGNALQMFDVHRTGNTKFRGSNNLCPFYSWTRIVWGCRLLTTSARISWGCMVVVPTKSNWY